MPTLNIPSELLTAVEKIYQPAGLKLTHAPQRESESDEYEAARFSLNNNHIVFRKAKITPTKIGQFVTVWKRPAREIAPLDTSDDIAFVIIAVHDATQSGQFILSQEALVKHGIMSKNGKGGKLGFRIYPPWTKPIAKDAIKSQAWQVQYFLPISTDGTADPALVKKLFAV